MKTATTVEELRNALNGCKEIALVPTMGALHEGHISLVKAAGKIGKTVVVSLFVNPTQFNDPKDLEKYPRTLQADQVMLKKAGANILFAPSVEEVYPMGEEVEALQGEWEKLATVMEGALRPGHFKGVVQVVGRLFDLVQPDKALFGEKDFQQLAIIRSMIAQQKRSIEIIGCPIVRDKDGLALSSRNVLLSADERKSAPEIHKAINKLKCRIESDLGESVEKLSRECFDYLKNIKYLCPEYISVVDPLTLQETTDRHNFRICAAVRCGSVRLIDNV